MSQKTRRNVPKNDVQNLTLREKVKPTFYLPYEQSNTGVKSFRASYCNRAP